MATRHRIAGAAGILADLGLSSIGLIEKTYGHHMDVRHRGDVLEYREAEVVDLEKRREA